MPNTLEAKNNYRGFLELRDQAVLMYYKDSINYSYNKYNTDQSVTNNAGLDMMVDMLKEYSQDGDSIYYIFYMENNRFKIAALTSRSALHADLSVYVDPGIGVGIRNTMAQNRGSMFRWEAENVNNEETLGFTTFVVDDENDIRCPSFLEEMVAEESSILPLGYKRVSWSYYSSTIGRRMLVNMRKDGQRYMRGLPFIGFKFDDHWFASPDFTLEEMEALMRQVPTRGDLNELVVLYNARLTLSSGSFGLSLLAHKCEGYQIDWRTSIHENQTTPIDELGRLSLLIKGHKYDNDTVPVRMEAINRIRSYTKMRDDGMYHDSFLFHTLTDSGANLIAYSIKGTSFAPKISIADFFKLYNKIPVMKERIYLIAMRKKPLIRHFVDQSGKAAVMFSVGDGTIVAHVTPDVDLENRTVTLKFTSDSKFMPFGAEHMDVFHDMQNLTSELGKKLKKEMNYDRLIKNAYTRLQRKSNELSKNALEELKKAAGLSAERDIVEVYDYANSTHGFAGPSFVVDLMKQLGPMGWGSTIISGNLTWYKDTLRYETRASSSDWASYANKDRPFMRFETSMRASIVLSKGPKGYKIDTNVWDVPHHPNINGRDGIMCQGGVGDSVLVRAHGKSDIVKDINIRNGTFGFREALKLINKVAQLLESSLIIGDVSTGFGGQTLHNFKTCGKGLVPLMKYNIFQDNVPEEEMKEIQSLYSFEKESLLLLLPPYIARLVFAGMRNIIR